MHGSAYPTTYKCVVATRSGGPEVLQVVERPLRLPAPGEARVRVLAAGVCRPDISARSGTSLYSGTPLGRSFPFVPGYSVIGDVDAVGDGVTAVAVGERVGALTAIGGYTEYLYWQSDRLIHVPRALDPAEAVTLILNYLVAYQTLHRSARVKAGEKLLIIGASGGIRHGTAATRPTCWPHDVWPGLGQQALRPVRLWRDADRLPHRGFRRGHPAGSARRNRGGDRRDDAAGRHSARIVAAAAWRAAGKLWRAGQPGGADPHPGDGAARQSGAQRQIL
ncbi:MAG: alcohol dehydrogenase catalytic domain-containing protein [Blastochloris sp.]|nr:alcohol dehydrogenase catalytic domain-containing protein [Blastochloris sp.]